ncbi:MAG: hypothetical protein WAL63_02270 [Solirubrobacteraceae bacterium]
MESFPARLRTAGASTMVTADLFANLPTSFVFIMALAPIGAVVIDGHPPGISPRLGAEVSRYEAAIAAWRVVGIDDAELEAWLRVDAAA